MATVAQSVPQVALVEELVKTAPLPKGVRLRRIFFNTDSTGDPAIRIVFVNSLSIPLTKPRVRILSSFGSKVREVVNAASGEYFAYITFEEEK